MSIGSLFAGIGGFDLAARWMGWNTKWVSEIEPYASAVLKKHFPLAPNHGDITQIRGADVEKVDILCGGFPCQDISVAGKGGGIKEGTRSGLWSHYARLVEEIRPRYVVAENVAVLRSRGLDRVLGDIHALGYDAEWHCIPASAVGAPHQRDRIWIIAHSRSEQQPLVFDGSSAQGSTASAPAGPMDSLDSDSSGARSWVQDVADSHGISGNERRTGYSSESARRWNADRSFIGANVPDTHDSRLEGHAGDDSATRRERETGYSPPRGPRGSSKITSDTTRKLPHRGGETWDRRSQSSDGRWWFTEPNVGRVAHGVPSRVDRLRCLGNAIVPQVAYFVFQAIQRREDALRLAA